MPKLCATTKKLCRPASSILVPKTFGWPTVISNWPHTYQEQEQADTALNLQRRAISILANHPKQGNIVIKKRIHAHLFMAEIFLELQKGDSLRFHVQAADQLSKQHLGKGNYWGQNILGQWYLKGGLYPEADHSFKKALDLAEKNFASFPRHPYLGECYTNLGNNALEAGQVPKLVCNIIKMLFTTIQTILMRPMFFKIHQPRHSSMMKMYSRHCGEKLRLFLLFTKMPLPAIRPIWMPLRTLTNWPLS